MAAKQKHKPLKVAAAHVAKDFRDEVSLTCACSRDLTLAELGRVFRARKKEQLEAFLLPLNEAFKTYGINTCLKKAHFLAQVGHESAQTRLLEESGYTEEMEKKTYGGYKGRGLMQLTYKDAYEKYGAYVGKDFLAANRVQLASPKYGSDSAGWFWKEYKGVDLSDLAQKNDFIYITQRINGAFNGWDDRLMLLNRAVESLLVDHCPSLSACFNFSAFKLESSAANESKVASFAFGFWFDPVNKTVIRNCRIHCVIVKFQFIRINTDIGKTGTDTGCQIGSCRQPEMIGISSECRKIIQWTCTVIDHLQTPSMMRFRHGVLLPVILASWIITLWLKRSGSRFHIVFTDRAMHGKVSRYRCIQ